MSPVSACSTTQPDREAGADHFELAPEKLVYGGAALGHYAGRAVFVPLALPAERVKVESVRRTPGVIHARLLEVITPSPERVTAPCPYFGRCGGCHYQHLDPARQSEVKREILRETLRRIGHIDWPGEITVHTAASQGYRNQVQLQVGRDENGQAALGFFAADSHRLIPINDCLIGSPGVNRIVRELARPEWSARLAGCSAVDVFADDRDEAVMVTLRCDAEDQDLDALAKDCLSHLEGVVSVAIEPAAKVRALVRRRRPLRSAPSHRPLRSRVFGKSRLTYRVGEFSYEVSPGSFFQASRFLLPEFVNAVTAGEPSSGVALDLYAGVGLFTLPLARRFSQVVAVEANPRAAADLVSNAQAGGFANVRAVAAPAADFLRRHAQAPDLAVLDPPRAGAEVGTLRRLAELGAQRIHYASCDPATLARDLADLLRHGYALESVELFDLFPQTFHIETLAKLRQARPPGEH